MSLSPSKSILRVKDGNIYGWSGSHNLTSSAVVLLDYNNPSYFYLTRINLGFDWSDQGPSEVLSYTVEVDGVGLFIEKTVLTDLNLGFQPNKSSLLYHQTLELELWQHNQLITVKFLAYCLGFRL